MVCRSHVTGNVERWCIIVYEQLTSMFINTNTEGRPPYFACFAEWRSGKRIAKATRRRRRRRRRWIDLLTYRLPGADLTVWRGRSRPDPAWSTTDRIVTAIRPSRHAAVCRVTWRGRQERRLAGSRGRDGTAEEDRGRIGGGRFRGRMNWRWADWERRGGDGN